MKVWFGTMLVAGLLLGACAPGQAGTAEDLGKAAFAALKAGSVEQLKDCSPSAEDLRAMYEGLLSAGSLDEKDRSRFEERKNNSSGEAARMLDKLTRHFHRASDEARKGGLNWTRAELAEVKADVRTKDNKGYSMEVGDVVLILSEGGSNHVIVMECARINGHWVLVDDLDYKGKA